MKARTATKENFSAVKKFYWDLIADMAEQVDVIGWKQGIYPTDEYLHASIAAQNLIVFEDNQELLACVIVNSSTNEGYQGTAWPTSCRDEEVLIPHALGVKSSCQGKGIGRLVVQYLIDKGAKEGKKALRLDILKGNTAAETLYKKMGFVFVEEKVMFYEDTGWTEYQLFERPL